MRCVAVAWAITGEITSARGSNASANALVAHLPKPLDWVDVAAGRQPVTFFGENIGDANGDVAARVLEQVDRPRLDARCDGAATRPDAHPEREDDRRPDGARPGHRLRAHERRSRGAGNDRRLAARARVAPASPTRGGCKTALFGRPGTAGSRSDALYVKLGPGRPRGTVTVSASRVGFCNQSAPKAHVTIKVGEVALNEPVQSLCSGGRS